MTKHKIIQIDGKYYRLVPISKKDLSKAQADGLVITPGAGYCANPANPVSEYTKAKAKLQ